MYMHFRSLRTLGHDRGRLEKAWRHSLLVCRNSVCALACVTDLGRWTGCCSLCKTGPQRDRPAVESYQAWPNMIKQDIARQIWLALPSKWWALNTHEAQEIMTYPGHTMSWVTTDILVHGLTKVCNRLETLMLEFITNAFTWLQPIKGLRSTVKHMFFWCNDFFKPWYPWTLSRTFTYASPKLE